MTRKIGAFSAFLNKCYINKLLIFNRENLLFVKKSILNFFVFKNQIKISRRDILSPSSRLKNHNFSKIKQKQIQNQISLMYLNKKSYAKNTFSTEFLDSFCFEIVFFFSFFHISHFSFSKFLQLENFKDVKTLRKFKQQLFSSKATELNVPVRRLRYWFKIFSSKNSTKKSNFFILFSF